MMLAGHGGELFLPNLHSAVRSIFEQYIGAVENFLSGEHSNRIFKNATVTLIRNLDVHAFAFRGSSGNCDVLVYAGLVAHVYDLFFKVMAQPEVLPGIGNPGLEAARAYVPLANLRYASNGTDQVEATLEHSFFSRLPQDVERQQFAVALAHFALLFVLQHEIAHIVGGHHEYLRTLSPVTRPILRALECDADRAAGYLSAIWVASIALDRRNSHHWFKTPDEVFHAWGFAIDLVFRLLDHVTRRSADYPRPETRYKMFSVGTLESIKLRHVELVDSAATGLAFAPQSGARTWDVFGWPISYSVNFERDQNDDAVLDTLDRILPDVRRFSTTR